MKPTKLHLQRNGVAGEGFYSCQYTMDGEKDLIALFTTLDDERTIDRTKCRVIDPNNLNNSYRGDVVADELNKWFAPCFKEKDSMFILYDMIEVINKTKKHENIRSLKMV